MHKTNYIIDIADKFLLNNAVSSLPISIETLEGIAHRNGWILETYATAQDFIENRHLNDLTAKCKAFVIGADGKHIILYDGNIDYNDKIFSICHEMGHIVLHHSLGGGMSAVQECEADIFAEEMISPTCSRARTQLQEDLCKQLGIRSQRNIVSIVILIACLVVLALSVGISLLSRNPERIVGYERSAASSSDTVASSSVYVTLYGEKYHIDGCHYIADKENLSEMTVEEAERKGYDPCGYCID